MDWLLSNPGLILQRIAVVVPYGKKNRYIASTFTQPKVARAGQVLGAVSAPRRSYFPIGVAWMATTIPIDAKVVDQSQTADPSFSPSQ